MIKPHHKKIAIIGNAGSGKTTIAFALQKKLNLPLYHLDQYYWLPNWERLGLEKFTQIHDELCKKDKWIIEGSYLKLVAQRVAHADVVIFLDMPRYWCIWNVIKRSVLHWGKIVPGNPESKQQLFTINFLKFLHWVWNFNKRYKTSVQAVLDEHEDKKQIYVFTTTKQIADFIK